jgi:hypothetical protein
MYRDAPPSGPACYKHASAPAAAQCHRCGRALCDPCVIYDVSSPHCFDCARAARRNRTLGAVAKIGGVLGALGVGVFFLVTRSHPAAPTFDSPELVRLHNKVIAERCDKRATLAYGEELVQEGEFRRALTDADDYFKRCEDWYRLRWVTYSAHEHLGEHALAAAEATKLMAHSPEDKDYVWWRGLAYEEMGRVDDAIADYRRAIQLEPRLDRIPFNLSNLLEQKQQFCEARKPIQQFVEHYPETAHRPAIVDRLERLRILGHCPQ